MKLTFKQVDVFTSVPFKGNPVAVILDADNLGSEEMQQIAAWTNLSETTFIQSSEKGDFKLRIFTPKNELPFAGHPTIGSACAFINSDKNTSHKKEYIQECQAGLVKLLVEADEIFATVPEVKTLDIQIPVPEIEDAIGCKMVGEPLVIYSGPVWATARIQGVSSLENMNVELNKILDMSKAHNVLGINVFCFEPGIGVFVRTFAPLLGVNEDPVCGSGNAAVAFHLKSTDKARISNGGYTAFQGASLNRNGIVKIRYEGDDILIGGNAVIVVDGFIRISND